MVVLRSTSGDGIKNESLFEGLFLCCIICSQMMHNAATSLWDDCEVCMCHLEGGCLTVSGLVCLYVIYYNFTCCFMHYVEQL